MKNTHAKPAVKVIACSVCKHPGGTLLKIGHKDGAYYKHQNTVLCRMLAKEG